MTTSRLKPTLFFGLVSQHGSDNNISDSTNAGLVGLELSINLDTPTVVDLNADFLQSQVVRVRFATDRDQNDISIQLEMGDKGVEDDEREDAREDKRKFVASSDDDGG